MTLPAAAANAAVLNITASTALRTSGAYISQVSVIVPGSAGAIFDASALGTGTVGRQVYVIPAAAGVYPVNWPCVSGVVVVPGAGQTLAISLA